MAAFIAAIDRIIGLIKVTIFGARGGAVPERACILWGLCAAFGYILRIIDIVGAIGANLALLTPAKEVGAGLRIKSAIVVIANLGALQHLAVNIIKQLYIARIIHPCDIDLGQLALLIIMIDAVGLLLRAG